MGSTLTGISTGVIAVATVVNAAATVVYVVLTRRLWKETKKSTEAAKASADAAKLSAEAAKESADIEAALHRPYLGVSVLRHNDYNQERWAIRCCVKNYGTIPASGVRASVAFEGRLTGAGGLLFDRSEIFPLAEVERFIEIPVDRGEQDLLHSGEPMAAQVEVTYDAPGGTQYTHKAAFPYDRTAQNFRLGRSETTGR
jgi:hypothetical protein